MPSNSQKKQISNELKKQMKQAKECMDSGRYDEALEVMNQVLKSNPDAARAYSIIGNIYYKMGRVNDAADHYEKALRIDPKLAPALMMMGNVYSELGDNTKAIDYFDSALKENPKLVKAQLKAGKMDMDEDRLDEAERRCQEAIKYDPQLIAPRLMLASIYQQKGDLDAAEQECRNIITINPEVIAAKVMLARIYLKQKNFSEAEQLLKAAIAMEPESGLETLFYLLGMTYFAMDRLSDAQNAMRKALVENEEFNAARGILIKVLMKQNQFEEALKEARSMGKRRGSSLGTHRLFAAIYSGMGQYGLACQEYQAAINNAPRLLDKYPELGEIPTVYTSDEARAEAYGKAFEEIIQSWSKKEGGRQRNRGRRGMGLGRRGKGRRRQANAN